MAKQENDSFATTAAEAIGSTLGKVVGNVEKLAAEHPHPMDEAREALAKGQAQLGDIAAVAGERVKAFVTATKKAMKQARPAKAKAKKRATKVVKRAKAAVKKTAKTAKRAVGRTKKAASR
jgi:hypothetical protein